MFRAFIVIIEIAALVMLLRTSMVQYWLSDSHESLSNWFLDISKSGERMELNDLRESIQPVTGKLKPYQQDYLMGVTSSKIALQDFHRRYCVDGDKNPYVYGQNLTHICSAINSSKLLSQS